MCSQDKRNVKFNAGVKSNNTDIVILELIYVLKDTEINVNISKRFLCKRKAMLV